MLALDSWHSKCGSLASVGEFLHVEMARVCCVFFFYFSSVVSSLIFFYVRSRRAFTEMVGKGKLQQPAAILFLLLLIHLLFLQLSVHFGKKFHNNKKMVEK
jgi:hypothetical protein